MKHYIFLQDSPAQKEESLWRRISLEAFCYVHPDYDYQEKHYFAWLYSADERIPQSERFRSSFKNHIERESCEEFDSLAIAQRIINEALGRDAEADSLWQ